MNDDDNSEWWERRYAVDHVGGLSDESDSDHELMPHIDLTALNKLPPELFGNEEDETDDHAIVRRVG